MENKKYRIDCTKSIIIFNTGLLCTLFMSLLIMYLLMNNLPLIKINGTNNEDLFFNTSKLKIIKDLLKYHLNRENIINNTWLNKTCN